MATVYLACVRGPAGFNKLLVVKCLRSSLAAEPEFLEMFLAEARLAARINHPNVVQTNEVGFDGQFYYIAMEYVDGPSVETIVRKSQEAFPVNLYLHVLIQALAGLHHAHELRDFDGHPLNVVHRDVSPHNIMVSYDGHVKLLDFGIAKAADSSGNTRTGILKGKCAYMAAEQFGGHNVDRRADIFSAGIILWQAITGARLWKGLSDAEIFSRLSRGEIPSPKTVKPDLPDQLVNICVRALALRPEGRYATAADFASDLEQFVATHPAYQASTRELARFVAKLFAEERTKMNARVEEQLRQVAANGKSLVTFAPEPPLSGYMAASSGITPTQGTRLARYLALAAAALAVLLVAGFVVVRRRASAAARDGLAAGAQATLTVRADPPAAKIFFDDAPLSGNPATATFARDGLAHRVRAEAPGFARKTELVTLDSANVSVALGLDPDSGDEVDPFGNKLTAVTIKASPPAARIYLDDVLLPTNPSTAKYGRDGKQHTVRCEAPGFLTKTQTVNFNASTAQLNLTLDKDSKAPAVPPPGAHHG
jgi:serine/threonine-protein kinase